MGGQQSQAPQAIPGYEWLGPYLQQLTTGTNNGMGMGPAGMTGYENNVIQGLGADPSLASNAFSQGLGAVQSSADPLAMFSGIEQKLRPLMVDDPFRKGQQDILSAASLTGTQYGTPGQQGIADFRLGLENSLQGAIPGVAGMLAGMQNQAGAQLMNVPSQLMGIFGQPRAATLGTLGTLGGASSAPMYQPMTSPGAMSTIGPLAGTALGAWLGGPGGAAAGNQAGGKAAGNSGGKS